MSDIDKKFPAKIKDFIHGGYYAGNIEVDGQQFGLIVMPAYAGELYSCWSTTKNLLIENSSDVDGRTNTENMHLSGCELAVLVRTLNVNNYSDWHIPSRYELDFCMPIIQWDCGADLKNEPYFWSSTQTRKYFAWVRDLLEPIKGQSILHKNQYIRPVRWVDPNTLFHV